MKIFNHYDEEECYTFIDEEMQLSSADEGNLKLQKIIRKRLQYLDDRNEPYGYRKSANDLLGHLLTWRFPQKEDDKRKQPKSPEQIVKMQMARKKNKEEIMKEYIENL